MEKSLIAITHERNSWKDKKDDRVGNNKYLIFQWKGKTNKRKGRFRRGVLKKEGRYRILDSKGVGSQRKKGSSGKSLHKRERRNILLVNNGKNELQEQTGN